MLAIVVLQLVSFLQSPNPTRVQPINPEKPLTVCEVLADLQKYRGKIIEVRDVWPGQALYGRKCQAPRTGNYEWQPAIWLTTPSAPPSTLDSPPTWELNEKAYWGAERKRKKAGWTVTATFVGRLDARAEGLQTGQGGTPDIVVGNGYGEFNRYPAQLVIVTVKDIVPEKVQRK